MDRISVESRISVTGVVPGWKANLVPIASWSYADLPHNRTAPIEGMIELRVNDTLMLGEAELGFGYVDQYWDGLTEFVEPLIALQSSTWALPGIRAHLRCEVTPGTRRGVLHLMIDHQSAIAHAIHVPSLVEALLTSATEWYQWLPEEKRFDGAARIERLRTAPAPWRS